MNKWSKKNLADIGSAIRGVSYSPSHLYENENQNSITLLRSNNIRNNKLNFEDVQYVNKCIVKEKQILKKLDIAICMSNGNRFLVGKSGQYNDYCNKGIFTVGSFCSIFRPNKSIDPEFARQLFCSSAYQKQIDLILSGSAINNLKGSDIEGIVVEIPEDVSEQSKIAEILSTVDRAIEQTEALIAKQQRIKTGLMQDLLTRGIDEHGNIRSEETHEFKDSQLGRIPVEWSYDLLGKCSNIHNNLRKPISALVRESMIGEYPYYGPTGILDYINEFRVEGRYVLIGEDGDHFLKYSFQEMTQLVNGKYNVNNHAHILSGNETVLTEWLYFYYMHKDITFYLTRQGAGRFKLNKATLLNLPIIYPRSVDEQIQVVQLINSHRLVQAQYIRNLNKLQSLKTALMQDLLTGNVRVTPLLEEETVSV